MKSTQSTTDVIAEVIPENIPEELKQRPQWVVWKLEKRREKLTKVPYIAGGSGASKADTTNMLTWRTFDEALEALGSGRYDGIGFVFSSGDPYTGIDLDNCRVPTSGEIAEWAQAWIDHFESYTEVSPSGTGVHIIVKGKTPHNGKRTVDAKTVEVYSTERFFTFTGVVRP